MISRALPRALALCCVGVGLSACNLTASQAEIQAALNPGMITAATITPANLSALGIDPVKAEAFAVKVQAAATAACSFEPSAEGIAALVAAAYPPAATVISITKIAGLACTAYKNRIVVNNVTAYSALDTKKGATAKPAPKPEPKPGEEVDGVVKVNGQTIIVPGVKK